MPPHGFVPLPLLMEVFASRSLSDEAPTKIPDLQFVDAVTIVTSTRELPPMIWIPSKRNLWTIPGPWITTPRNPLTRIPTSPATWLPAQPVTASPCPVIENPFSFSAMPDAPKLMHAAPVTVQVTLPTSWLLSVIVSVLEMVPLIFVADAVPEIKRRLRTTPDVTIGSLMFFMSHLAFRSSRCERTCVGSCDLGKNKRATQRAPSMVTTRNESCYISEAS